MQWSFQDFQETHMYIKTKDVHNCSSTDLSSSLQNALETKKKGYRAFTKSGGAIRSSNMSTDIFA